MRTRRGMTLLEIMVVVAIIGVLAALSVSTVGELGARNATQNGAADFSAALARAKSLAAERSADVVVLVYPTYKKNIGSADALTGGNGAYFVYLDTDGDFMQGGTATDGDLNIQSFDPIANRSPTTASKDRLITYGIFDTYPKKNVRFFTPQTGFMTVNWGADMPFSGITTRTDTRGCSFCDATGGAMVFSGDRQVRFFTLATPRVQASERVQGLVLQSPKTPSNQIRFGVVAATGFVSSFK